MTLVEEYQYWVHKTLTRFKGNFDVYLKWRHAELPKIGLFKKNKTVKKMRTLEVALLIQYCYRENDLENLNLPIFVTYAFLHFTQFDTTEVMLVFLSKMLLLDVLNGDKTEIFYQSNYCAGKAELWTCKRRSFRDEGFVSIICSIRTKKLGCQFPPPLWSARRLRWLRCVIRSMCD